MTLITSLQNLRNVLNGGIMTNFFRAIGIAFAIFVLMGLGIVIMYASYILGIAILFFSLVAVIYFGTRVLGRQA